MQAGLVFTILAGAYLVASRGPGAHRAPRPAVLGLGALVLAAGHGPLLAGVADVGTGGSVPAPIPGLLLVGAEWDSE